MNDLIEKVKQKKEFSWLPDSVVERAVNLKGDVKGARALLRKYFGVFLTNKLVKGKLSYNEILKKHLSTKERDYEILYRRILGDEKVVVDLGAGVNGLSIGLIGKKYIAIEAMKFYVELMNKFFKEEKIKGRAIWMDLFDLKKVVGIIKKEKEKKVVFMFQIVSALEIFEKDFSKKFILEISKNCEKIVLSFPLKSLSGKRRFNVSRRWLLDFIEDNFKIEDDFKIGDERFVVFGKR